LRSLVLWQASQGYDRIDSSRRVLLLNDAFHAAVSIPDDNADIPCFIKPDECHSKPWLETQILSLLTSLAPEQGEGLLRQAEPDVRHVIVGLIISHDVRKGNLDHAEQLLHRVAEEKDFPYDAAAQLLVSLPPAKASERVVLFTLAMTNFQNFGKDELMRSEDLGTFIIRFAKDIPASTVLEAIDLVLKQAKEVDERDEKPQMSLSSRKGSVALSYYEYRLFELLPVLEELDPSRADSLLKEHQQAAAALKQYPSGMASLDPTLRDTPLSEDEERHRDFMSIGMRNNPTPADAAADQAIDRWYEQVQAQTTAALELMRTDPKQALSIAMTIPLWGPQGPRSYSPRAQTLGMIAVGASKKDPDVAGKALEAIQEVADQISPNQGGRLLTETADAYINMGEPEQAEKVLRQGMTIAQKLYESDVDSLNPNLAMKAKWPSAGLWRKLVMLGTKVSPDFGLQLMAEIPDPEIRVLQEVSYANALLGSNDYFPHALVWHKDGSHNSMMAF
jgi:hypothetical protein